MTADGQPGPGGLAVDSYLAELKARLPGPARARAGIVAELRSGLMDAADAHRSAGLPPAQAALAAIAEFGEPAQVADGFRAEIAAGQARRVAASLLVTGPLVGLLWIATATTSHLSIGPALGWHQAGTFPGFGVGIYLVAVAAGVTAWGAVVGIAVTGRAHPLAAVQAAPGADRRCGRRLQRGLCRRARSGAARRRAGRHARKALPAAGRCRGGGEPRPAAARPARRAPVPHAPRKPGLTPPLARPHPGAARIGIEPASRPGTGAV